MNIATKAALLSALVFPGVGHIFLKRYLAGSLLIFFSFIAISYLVSKITENALKIVEKIQRGDIALDTDKITELVLQQTGTDTQLLNIATTLFIICWLIGIVDSYRIARKL